MVKVRVIQQFNLKDFDKLINVVRIDKDIQGTLFVGDTFQCDEKMANYLLGKNDSHITVVEVVEEVQIIEELPTDQTGEEITQEDTQEQQEKKPKKKYGKK